ncbi:MAG: C69 family dipeptidase [Salinivirgaceae bacterium]|nr:C69 family dipeptidase [Salinivirgaceae bacterium]
MKMKAFLAISMSVAAGQVMACTNFLVTPGASADGSSMVSYAADSHVLYGELYHWPAATYPAGTMLDVYDWDTGKYMGQIEQAAKTYNVIGNMNENQVVIGETTYGGREELWSDSTAIMDYGSLIYITLQRATSAREAIKIMTELVAKYGYASEGESFSIADPNEVWIFELIGKGMDIQKTKKGLINKNKGAVWVARQIPDGYVCAHANQARITTFPLNDDPTSISSDQMDRIFDKNITTVYAADVMDFARAKGYINDKVSKSNFSFSDTYAPVDFVGARACEIRVWAFFNDVADGMAQYWDYAKGVDIKHDESTGYASNRIPLWVKPKAKVSLVQMMHNMRNHLEGTELDMSQDVGAGPWHCPYRWRPMDFEVDGKKYVNERTTATQQTGFSFVAQCRGWLPNKIGGLFWFGTDDTGSTVYCPMYASMTTVPNCFAVGNGSMMEFSETAAFWAFNQVSNFAYTRYSLIHPEVEAKQTAFESKFETCVKAVDKAAQALLADNQNVAVEYLTDFSVNTAEQLVRDWKDFYKYLFVKYMDGNVKTPREVPAGYKYYAPKVEQPGYDEKWMRSVVNDAGDKLRFPDETK